jgi:acetyl esterase/lipase
MTKLRTIEITLITLFLTGVVTMSEVVAKEKQQPEWPSEVKEIKYKCSADDSMQAAMFYAPKTDKPVPLLVNLHTWSGGYTQISGKACARWCIEKGWVYIHPDFRGPNWPPQAMGSELVVQDIIDAVKYAKSSASVNNDRIYLIGGSGGGYASLLMAGRAPEIWAGVSAWCPISDLKKWHAECKKAGRSYYKHIEKACQGEPDSNNKAAEECKKRSAITYLKKAAKVPLDISTGIHDGHTGSVPVSHTLEAFNAVATAIDRISEKDITYFVEKEAVPPHLKEKLSDPLYGKNTPLFRKISGNVRVTIFEGGHNILYNPGLLWLEKQRKGKKAVWETAKTSKIKFSEKDSDVAK